MIGDEDLRLVLLNMLQPFDLDRYAVQAAKQSAPHAGDFVGRVPAVVEPARDDRRNTQHEGKEDNDDPELDGMISQA